MAPEQVSGNREVGPTGDIYALGVVLYELVAGERPLSGANDADTIRKVVCEDAPSLHRRVAGTPRDLSAICSRCLERSP